MAKLTPQQATEKWLRNARNAGESYRTGVNAVTEAPGAKAAAKADKWMQNLQASRDKWAQRVGDVSLSEWKTATINKGQQRYLTGVEEGAPKMAEFMQEFLPFAQQVSAEVQAMPDLTLEQNIQRMVTAVRRISEFRRS